ncbi:M14 family zinc carboxypeptidase [Streptomyces sp. WMMC1477]|uniref:M14 family zinc carboxypeptidase n=1 Tax=Streptomyces sp. WMMC1477 TaxID=3015155 RepID=UPI0022B7526D|nr:M14 family zinc carboxypeptidase [Streptomyces sp. WMMC1477]MCZ7433451.1 M14 family zinc carboxypeptidase [Streptomyces sp. WMMC1477]
MRKKTTLWLVAAATTAALAAGTGYGVAAPPPDRPAAAEDDRAYVYRVHDGAHAAESALAGFDLIEDRDADDLFVLGDAGTAKDLKAAGLKATVEQKLTPAPWEPPKRSGQAPRMTAEMAEETYYGGYRTVNAQYAHLDQVAADHSSLATVFDVGDSWRKATGRSGGYDLKAICITKKQSGDCQLSPNSTKPRLFVQAQVHARELTTGEMAYRWIDYLTDGYGSDATATEILDTREVWVVPIGNPDGVDMVQQGFMGGPSGQQWHRKNANHTHSNGCYEGSYGGEGIDLNRNNGSHWGGAGTSSDPCSKVYKGPSADSEVETQALHALYRDLFPDTRSTGDGTAADPDTQGMFITMHSYSNMVLFPWGFDSSVETGNDAAMRAMAQDMASLAGGWQYGQPGEILYNASGSHDDWAYDDLGVPSFTWEVGPSGGSCGGFHPDYSCQNTFWNQVKPMLVYAAENAENPYGGGSTPPPSDCSVTNGTNLSIPDNGSAVTSSIQVSGCGGTASSTSTVEVHVEHTWRGDLVVDLIAPDGSTYPLKSASGSDSADDIHQTYTVDLSGEARDGTWKLRLQDTARYDTGYLDTWTLSL